MPDDPGARELRDAVLGYLAEHPHAAETFDGIAEWWIGRRRVRVDAERLWRVIQQMVQDGVLDEFGTGNERRYRLKTPPDNGR